jgi:hypothetical protein
VAAIGEDSLRLSGFAIIILFLDMIALMPQIKQTKLYNESVAVIR